MLNKVLILIFTLSASFSSVATKGTVTGAVTLIRSQDATIGGDWFQIDVASAGICGKYGSNVIFRLKDDDRGKHQFSMVLAAKMANKPVTVSYDDVALMAGNYCYVRYLDI